jgi:uncharacterized membrane protein
MSRALYLVPVLGAALIGINDRGYGLDQLWLWSSLGLWSMAAALAQTIVWPGETTIRERLQDTASGDLPADLRATCGHVALAAGLGAVCMTIVFPVMVLKPGAPGH